MFRRFIATTLSVLLLFAAAISPNDETAIPEALSPASSPPAELSFAGFDEAALPDYPDAISQRLLRKRVSPRALMGQKTAAVITFSSCCKFVDSSPSHRSSPQDLFQHQTSLRI
jgi:hypothetical protein